MIKRIKDFIEKFGPVATAAMLVLAAVELEVEGPGKGAEKKQLAQERIKQLVDPLLPDFANPVVVVAVGFFIDSLVAFANKTGFFERYAAA